MKIIVCFKSVPEEQDIYINPDRTLNMDQAQWKIGQYDLNAFEAGATLAKETDGRLIALTAGGSIVESSSIRKSVLSRGPEELISVLDNSLENSDSYATALVLAAAVKKIGDADLIICGEGSGDIYAQQVGSVLGGLLGLPTINAVKSIEVNGESLILERSLEDGVEILEVSLPAVISVTADINRPRIPGMRDILGAGKKPAALWSISELETDIHEGLQSLEILAPEQNDRKQIILTGDDAENIEALYQHLRKVL